MILKQRIVLTVRNARDKVQLVIGEMYQDGNNFLIRRFSGQFGGKLTEQASKTIEKGKAKRTVLAQAELEFNSIVNKWKDKGYKDLATLTKTKLEDLSESELDSLVPSLKTDSNGNVKPMLAKSSDACKISVFEKPMWCSKKLNGVRMLIRWDNELQKPVTISRGGKDYDVAAKLILEQLHDFMKENPTWILDGEFYKHGMHLQEISGISRLKTWSERCNQLEFWIYDIADGDLIFSKRYDMLQDLQIEVEHPKYSKIKVCDHELTKTWADVQKYHDKWVAEGFEGLVARKPEKTYQFGKRGSDMIKVKQYKDAEFEIIDYKEGLRPEDFVFVCITEEGKQFEAKPTGTREQKQWYLDNIDDIIGEFGSVKYFEWSKDGIPVQTVFQCVRYNEDAPVKSAEIKKNKKELPNNFDF